MNQNIHPYWNKNHTKYAILLTDGYNCGWTVMNEYSELAYDSRVVEYVIEHMKIPNWQESFDFFRIKKTFKNLKDIYEVEPVREFNQFLESLGYSKVYLPPIAYVKIVWMKPNVKWRIITVGECSEEIEYESDVKWISFSKDKK